MTEQEAIKMMRRCKNEIAALRREIDCLRPKADAYNSIAQVLSLLPQPSSMSMGEDMVWMLDQRIREIEETAKPAEANPVSDAF